MFIILVAQSDVGDLRWSGSGGGGGDRRVLIIMHWEFISKINLLFRVATKMNK